MPALFYYLPPPYPLEFFNLSFQLLPSVISYTPCATQPRPEFFVPMLFLSLFLFHIPISSFSWGFSLCWQRPPKQLGIWILLQLALPVNLSLSFYSDSGCQLFTVAPCEPFARWDHTPSHSPHPSKELPEAEKESRVPHGSPQSSCHSSEPSHKQLLLLFTRPARPQVFCSCCHLRLTKLSCSRSTPLPADSLASFMTLFKRHLSRASLSSRLCPKP